MERNIDDRTDTKPDIPSRAGRGILVLVLLGDDMIASDAITEFSFEPGFENKPRRCDALLMTSGEVKRPFAREGMSGFVSVRSSILRSMVRASSSGPQVAW